MIDVRSRHSDSTDPAYRAIKYTTLSGLVSGIMVALIVTGIAPVASLVTVTLAVAAVTGIGAISEYHWARQRAQQAGYFDLQISAIRREIGDLATAIRSHGGEERLAGYLQALEDRMRQR